MKPNGTVNLPLIGPILFGGRTPSQIVKELNLKMKPYFIKPKAAIKLIDRNGDDLP